MRAVSNIVFASTNRHKFEEFSALLQGRSPVELIPADQVLRNASKLGMVETHSTYLENAVAKARVTNHGSHYPCLADDTGLEVEILGGRPGIKTHRYAVAKSGQSQDLANIEKLLTELKSAPSEKRQAKFITTVALVVEGLVLHATGVLEGTIAESPRGKGGFGYDPLFIPKGHTRTLAEMSAEEKNRISHRAAAIDLLLRELNSKGVLLAKP